ncbi:MAG: O-antigen ligase family protein [Prevotella sp.]|nr:O-antigen ligase family protein [Prevotella sp.]
MGQDNKTYNTYDITLLLILASLAFGGLGGYLHLSRVLAVLLLPWFIPKFKECGDFIHPFVNCFIAFLVFCAISLIWTPDIVEGFKELVYYFVHFLLFLEILVFSRFANNPLKSIAFGWVLTVGLTLVVALWEITTDNHLGVSRIQDDLYFNTGDVVIQRHFAAVTFANFNGYTAFLCFALPFLFYLLFDKNATKYKILVIVEIALAIMCMFYNASRGGFISLIIMFSLIILMTGKSMFRFLILASFVFIALYYYSFYSEDLEMLQAIEARASGDRILEAGERAVIWNYGWDIMGDTFGLGLGIGGMSAGMGFYKSGVTAIHNMFFEVLFQYGIVFFAVFIIYLINLFVKAVRSDNRPVKTLLFLALIPMPVYSIINSGYLWFPFVFAAFASLTVFANYERIGLVCEDV